MRPSDFFLSVVSFFAILLPGAILTFLWRDVPAAFQLHSLSVSDWPSAIAFFVMAYLVGQVLYAFGSWFLDPLYSRTYVFYKRWKKGVEGDALLKPQINVPVEATTQEKVTGTYAWARAYVAGRSPNAAASIERLDADSKFFRSLVVVLALAPYGLVHRPFALRQPLTVPTQTITIVGIVFLIAAVLYIVSLLIEGQYRNSKHEWTLKGHHLFKWLGILPTALTIGVTAGAIALIVESMLAWAGGLAYLLAMAALFVRFANQRWERDDTAYEFVLSLPPDAKVELER